MGEKKTGESGPVLERSRIAVLPFANMSPDSRDSYFADGIYEEIMSTLSRMGGLSVISRTSTMRYKETTKTAGEIGAELSVGSILEGSFRKVNNRIRVTTQLIDSNTDEHVWAQSYDRSLGDVFEVQSDIAKRVAQALRISLQPSELGRIESIPTKSTEALSLYLNGRRYWSLRTEEGIRRAIYYFGKAVKDDPEYALAYSGLADCYYAGTSYGYFERKTGRKKSRDFTLKALDLDNDLAEAHASLGWGIYHEIDWNWAGAEEELREAIELSPSYATAHQWLSLLLSAQGSHEEAILQARKSLELDPLSKAIRTTVASAYWYAHKSGKAIRELELAAKLDPEFFNFYNFHAYLGVIYVGMGEVAHGVRELERAVLLGGNLPVLKADLGYAFGKAGNRKGAAKILEDLQGLRPVEKINPLNIAEVYLGLGEREESLKWLETAFEERVPDFRSQVAGPVFEELRSSPRFMRLLAELGIKG
ncbi:MAG: tetratricopeptide repeat protein [Thaumarchaeota archaeon]|nr:tetratricopeptide repeat protein [Nitrososphaerota archaeon]